MKVKCSPLCHKKQRVLMDAPIRYEKVLPFKQTVYEGNREKALVILALWRTKRTQKVFIFLLLAKNEMTGKMWIFSFAVDNFIFWKVGTASQFKLTVVFLEFKHTHRYFTSHYVEAKLLSTTYSKLSLEYHEGQLASILLLRVTCIMHPFSEKQQYRCHL